jgi:hypothetical protein
VRRANGSRWSASSSGQKFAGNALARTGLDEPNNGSHNLEAIVEPLHIRLTAFAAPRTDGWIGSY